MPKKKLVIYTASFGDHDEPEGFPVPDGVDLVCFTDKPELRALPYFTTFVRRRVFQTARMDAKWYKLSATHLFPEHEHSIYLDSSIRVRDVERLLKLTDLVDENDPIAFFGHPEAQRSLEEEAEFSLTFPKYHGEPILEQVAHYRNVGFSQGNPSYFLYAGGVIVRHHWAYSQSTVRFEKAWLDECINWSCQDQISLPYVIWRQGVYPKLIEGNIYDNEILYRVWSGPNR